MGLHSLVSVWPSPGSPFCRAGQCSHAIPCHPIYPILFYSPCCQLGAHLGMPTWTDAGLILHRGSLAIMTLEEPVQMILAIYRTTPSSKFLAQRSACI